MKTKRKERLRRIRVFNRKNKHPLETKHGDHDRSFIYDKFEEKIIKVLYVKTTKKLIF
jgi:hypothetical protein